MIPRCRPVSFVNARVVADRGEVSTLRFDSRILGLGAAPRRGDGVIDLEGSFVFPGLVNAHDHLELNHYGRLKFRDHYMNARAWIDDMRPRLKCDARLLNGQAHPLAHRLFIGALKNLLAGATTVAHHNPFYKELRACPIRVVQRYGWAHSFALERAPAGARGEPGGDVAARHRATPPDAPFFVHLAEGVDDEARTEVARIERLGCVAPNVILIHGVAIDPADWPRLAERGASLVWCPGSNLFLFNRTTPVDQFLERLGPLDSARGRPGETRIALGTDSRLSGARDLLDELRIAAGAAAAPPRTLFDMVTRGAGIVLRQRWAGRIEIGAPADLLIVPASADAAARALLKITRRDVRLVIVGGRPLVGDPMWTEAFAARGVRTRPIAVDGVPKLAEAALAARIAACPIAEPGVEAA